MARRIRRRSFRRRRSRSRKAAPKRRGRVSRFRKRVRGGVKSQWGKISGAIGGLVFLSQITMKDRQAGVYRGLSMGEKAKVLVDNVLGRAFGVNPFGGTFEQTINVDGAFNKFTGTGLALIGYSLIPFKGLPHKSKAKTLGKSIFTGGFLGGLLDAPEFDTRNRVQAQRPAPRLAAQGMQVTTA